MDLVTKQREERKRRILGVARQLSDEGLLGAMLYGTRVTLLGLARGKAAAELERLVREHQAAAAGILHTHPRQTAAHET